MFTIDDDFEVDEHFLESAFASETCEQNSTTVRKAIPFKEVGNSQPSIRKSQGNTSLKNRSSEFLDLWNASEEHLFFSKSPTKTSNPKNLIDSVRAISPIGVRSEVITRTSKHVRPRKFPGPAGLLPARTGYTSFIAAEEYINKIESEDENYSSFEDKEVLSQASNKLFEDPGSAWSTMIDELGPNGSQLINNIHLSSIRVKQAIFGFKVPFLAVYVQNIDCSLPDPSLLLKDKMDVMEGALHREVWDEWKDEIVVGSVLVLRNTGVISAGSSARKFLLNITANNISTIYTPKIESNIKITQIQSVSGLNTDEILEEWGRVMAQTRQQQLGSESPQARSLYGSFPSTASPFRPQGVASPVPSMNSRVAMPTSRSFTSPMRPTFRPRASHNWNSQSSVGPQSIRSHRPPLNNHRHGGPRHQGINKPQAPTPSLIYPHMVTNPSQRTHASSSFSSPNIPNGMQTNFPNKLSVSGIHPKPNQLICNNNIVEPTVPLKKSKMSVENDYSKPSTSSVFSVCSPANKSIVDSVLDGVDTDLLFDDF